MKTFHVGFDQVARIAHVSEGTVSRVPTGGQILALGNFRLPEDIEDEFGYERTQGNRTVFHEVRDKLYKIGEQNMQAVQIKMVDGNPQQVA